ncbi:STAS domain-containing protein [Streptomyces sp. NPDC060243]|uniref:STAS domain-containing protein n=1 Tax=Streptomyces sp. NPDC060243 TaxID=3347081 RepID=UPI0036498FDB
MLALPVLALPALPAPADVPALHRRVAALARRSGTLVLDLDGFAAGGLAAVDLLARLALTARQHGCGVRLRGVPHELDALLGALGLADVLGVSPPAPGTPRGR